MSKGEFIYTATDKRHGRSDEDRSRRAEAAAQTSVEADDLRAEAEGEAVEDEAYATDVAAKAVDEAGVVTPFPNHEGFASEAEFRRHLAAVAADAPAEETINDLRLREDLARLRIDVESIRARIDVIKQQAQTVVSANVRWADASAHAQLGSYPWAKLAGAMAATVIVAKLLRRLPLGAIATVFAPLILGDLTGTQRPRRR